MRWIWFVTAVLIAGAGITAVFFPEADKWWIAGFSAAALLMLLWLRKAVMGPVRSASLGMALLRSGEFNNRLARVGEPHADRIVGVFNNLLERLSEERLRLTETNRLLDLLVAASPLGVAMMDCDRRVVFLNPAFVKSAGVNPGEVRGKEFTGLSGEVWKVAASLPDGGERVITLGNGMEIYRLSRMSFMEKGFRRPFLLLERLTDEIRRAEKEAYGKVIRTIAHEVNNTIGGLSSFLETLLDIEGEESEIGQLAASCLAGCGGMAEFIRGYAEVVKVGEPVKRKVDLNAEIQAMFPFVNAVAGENVAILTELVAGELPVDVDMAMFRQALVNIVKNGAESVRDCGHPAGEGKVILRTVRRARNIYVEIEDNGKGITPENGKRLFNPFFAACGGPSDPVPGSGG